MDKIKDRAKESIKESELDKLLELTVQFDEPKTTSDETKSVSYRFPLGLVDRINTLHNSKKTEFVIKCITGKLDAMDEHAKTKGSKTTYEMIADKQAKEKVEGE